jgi:hypothetical protein
VVEAYTAAATAVPSPGMSGSYSGIPTLLRWVDVTITALDEHSGMLPVTQVKDGTTGAPLTLFDQRLPVQEIIMFPPNATTISGHAQTVAGQPTSPGETLTCWWERDGQIIPGSQHFSMRAEPGGSYVPQSVDCLTVAL